MMFDSNRRLFLIVLPFLKFLDQSKIISEPWYSGSKGRMSIARYLPKNLRRRRKTSCSQLIADLLRPKLLL